MTINAHKPGCSHIGLQFHKHTHNIFCFPQVAQYFGLPRQCTWVLLRPYLVVEPSSVHTIMLFVPMLDLLNAIFGEIGRNASEEMVLPLVVRSRLSRLLYVTEPYCATKAELDSWTSRFLFSNILFKTSSSSTLVESSNYFIHKYSCSFNKRFCRLKLMSLVRWMTCSFIGHLMGHQVEAYPLRTTSHHLNVLSTL
jgi:hypothetical protein